MIWWYFVKIWFDFKSHILWFATALRFGNQKISWIIKLWKAYLSIASVFFCKVLLVVRKNAIKHFQIEVITPWTSLIDANLGIKVENASSQDFSSLRKPESCRKTVRMLSMSNCVAQKVCGTAFSSSESSSSSYWNKMFKQQWIFLHKTQWQGKSEKRMKLKSVKAEFIEWKVWWVMRWAVSYLRVLATNFKTIFNIHNFLFISLSMSLSNSVIHFASITKIIYTYKIKCMPFKTDILTNVSTNWSYKLFVNITQMVPWQA